MNKLRVLMVAMGMPYPPIGGAQNKLFYLLREVSKHTLPDLLLFPTHEPGKSDLDSLRQHVNRIEVYPYKPRLGVLKGLSNLFSPYPLPIAVNLETPVRKKVAEAVRRNSYDLVHVEGGFLSLALVGLKTPPRLIVPHDAYYWNYLENLKMAPWYFKPLLALDLTKFRFFEPRVYGYYDAVGMCTTLDAHAVKKLNPRLHVGVISNGVDLTKEIPNPQVEEYPSLVFSGSFDYPPNERAALRLLRDIVNPLRRRFPDLKLFIVGNRPTRRMKKVAAENPLNVITGRVRVMREWIAKGSVYCSPLRYGVGFKNKVPEAWAMKRPLVATPKTMEGIDFIPGRDALVAETDHDLIRACAMLLGDRSLRRRIGEAGRRRVEEQYNWPMLAEDLLILYDYVASQAINRR